MGTYTYIWEYRIKPGCEAEFEWYYNPDGTWAKLIRKSPAWRETRLLKDQSVALCYLTLDRWQSHEDYRELRSAFAREYTELDQLCAELTVHEAPLGKYAEPL